MNKKRLSVLLAGLMIFSNATSAFAMSNEEHQQIQGNSLLIGNHLFELDKNAKSFDLDSFITSARSIADGEDNKVYYKDASGEWYELIEDSSMSSAVAIDKIDNKITVRNGVVENISPTVLASTDLFVSPATIVENTTKPGTFDTEVTVTIKASNKAKFAANVGTTVDSISSASLLGTAPDGTNMQITRVDDKNIKLKLIGTASNHAASINATEGSAKNQKDYNKNGTYGDIKFLMLADFFTGVQSVVDGGQYVILDVQFNDSIVADKIINAKKSDVMVIENVDYGVLVLDQGDINTYNFTLNGAVLEPTKVNDSGTVVKFEMNPRQVAEVKLVSKADATKIDTIKMGSGTEAFTAVIKDQDPDKVLVSGPVSRFEYHLVDYDDNGVIRSALEKTTFDTENEGVKPVDKTVPVLTLETQRTLMGNDIVINVADPESMLSKKWMANVYDILKDYNMSASSRVPVQFSIDKDAGKIMIKATSTAIDGRNGHHEVVIKSIGYNDIHVKFETIEKAGKLNFHSDFKKISGNDLLFVLEDFNYGAVNPIHSVYLDGEKLKGDSKEYSVVSNLVRLENDALDKLTPGEHKVVVKAHGFEDYERVFYLRKPMHGESNPSYGKEDEEDDDTHAMLTVDAVSAASGSGGGLGGSTGGSTGGDFGGSGGGGLIRANVIYDFDLLSNAFILKALEMDTPYSNRVADRWSQFTKDAIITNGSDVLMSYKFYNNNVGVYEQYKTFEEAATALLPDKNPELPMLADKDSKIPEYLYVNRPYNVKNMLHDGQIGNIFTFGDAVATSAPTLSVENGHVLYGQDVVVKYVADDDAVADAWANALIEVKENGAYMRTDVDTNANTITFKAEKNNFLTGPNRFMFTSEGFKNTEVEFDIYKASQKNVTIKKDGDNNVILEGFDSDFVNNFTSISLANKSLYNDSQYGGNKGQYEIRNNQIILRSMLFGSDENQSAIDEQLSVKVKAKGYSECVINFKHKDLKGGTVELIKVPEFVQLLDTNKYIIGEKVEIDITGLEMSGSYAKAIHAVYLDGSKLASEKYSQYNHNLVLDGSLFGEAKDYTIKIVAEKYKDKEISVTITDTALEVPSYVTFEQDGKTVNMGEKLILSFKDSDYINISDYAKSIKTIKIGGQSYDVSLDSEEYDISSKVKTGQNDIVVIADNYENKKFTVVILEMASPAKFVVESNVIDNDSIVLKEPKEVKIYLSSESENLYQKAFKEVYLNDTKLTSEQYEIRTQGIDFRNSYILVLKEENFVAGETYAVKIIAENYADTALTVNVDKASEEEGMDVPEDVKLLQGQTAVEGNQFTFTEKQNEIKIAFPTEWGGPSEYENAFLGDEGQIIVDKISTETSKDLIERQTISGRYVRVLTIDTSSVMADEYQIVLKAKDYKSKKFTITIDSDYRESVPSFVGLKGSNSTVSNELEIKNSEEVSIIIANFNSSDKYKDNVTSLEITNTEVTTDAGTIIKTKSEVLDNNRLSLTREMLRMGLNTVKVKATGFEEYVGEINVVEADVPNFIGIFDESKMFGGTFDSNTVTLSSGKDVILIVGDEDRAEELYYIDSINAIKVNGTIVKDYTEKSTYGYSNATGYTIPQKYFVSGETITLTVESYGFETAEYTITVE